MDPRLPPDAGGHHHQAGVRGGGAGGKDRLLPPHSIPALGHDQDLSLARPYTTGIADIQAAAAKNV